MRLLAVLLATLTLTNVMAEDSFCVKYAKIVFNKNATTLTGTDEYNLISAVVARVVVGCDNNAATQFGVKANLTGTIFANYAPQPCGTNGVTKVNGLVSDRLNAPFFAGIAPDYKSVTGLQALNTAAGIPLNATFPSIRFVGVNGQSVTPYPATTGNITAGTEGLIQHLVSFFGNAFGCSSYNANQNTPSTNPSFIGRYNGNGNMLAVHQNMNITMDVWTEFITTFGQSLASFGVPQADITNMVLPIVNQFLLGANQICNDKATCACANIGGTPATNVNGTCVANAATTAPPATTSPPTTSAPTQHSSASTVAISAATIFGAVLLAFL